MESSEIDLRKFIQLIFDKGVKAIPWSKESLSTNGARAIKTSTSKKKKGSRHRLYIHHKR